MPVKKLIGYDLDGTLADTRKDIVEGVRAMLKAMHKPDLSAEEIEKCVGEGLNHLVSKTLGETDPKIVEQGARHLRKYYKEHLLDFTTLYPSAQNVLERFKDRIQIVITNKPEPFTTRILTELGVLPYLKGIYTGEQGLPHKPDPASLLKVMSDHGVKKEEVLWVGDSAIDAETGKRAGVETVLLRHGFSSRQRLEDLGANYLVDDFAGLLKLADQNGW